MADRKGTGKPAALMVQGTGSNVGKSVIVAGLARLFANRGLSVRPFKPQNMSNNAGVAVDGGEIGRAQMTQALAARVPPSVHMNPVLLKPESETGAQVIVRGKRFATMKAREYGLRKSELMGAVMESFAELGEAAELLLVEGAGSPAEINLRAGDIANMGFAEAAGIPVVLVGDIDRGGVIASLVGTHAVLPETERQRIRGFIVNRFRGDVGLFDNGVREIETRTGWPCLGVVPHLADVAKLPAEDVLGLADGPSMEMQRIRIAVPQLGRIANFDDLDPLRAEPSVDLAIVPPGEALPGDADLILLPGSKSTISDLHDLREQGWDIDIAAHVRRGGSVLGICGGYQMLGMKILDPDGVEGPAGGQADGLGLLEVETVLEADKTVQSARGTHRASGEALSGYEIHMGRTNGPDAGRPFSDLSDHSDGAVSINGRICGTYLHGLFASDPFRSAYLTQFGGGSQLAYEGGIDMALDRLADHLARHLDVDRIMNIARGVD
ncbi:MAG TPA: cobyric acid synthase [Afifellaceae bacterium]|nr:cobyric acid synthase [Afifellaceae bacterium]